MNKIFIFSSLRILPVINILTMVKIFPNKKVLLSERKRHTACRVVSTPSVVLLYLLGTPPRQGTPHPDLAGGYLTRVPSGQGIPSVRVLPWPGYPPSQGPPPAGPGRVSPPPAAPWHSGKCCKALWDMGTLPVDKLTK